MMSYAQLLAQYAPLIAENRQQKVQDLALSLQALPEAHRLFVLQQVEGWQRMQQKVPQLCQVAQYVFPPRLSLEQCSGAAAAQYKAEVVKTLLPKLCTPKPEATSLRFADLTGGMGIDFIHLAPLFDQAYYVEQREDLVEMAKHNFAVLGLKANCVCSTAEDFLLRMEKVDLLFLDPARRNTHGGKTVLLEDCSPNVLTLLPQLLEKCRYLLLKLSTMIALPTVIEQLACVSEAHVFAERGECKDVLLLCTAQHKGETRWVCANEKQRFSFFPSEEQQAHCPLRTNLPQGYLYEADAAVMKAQAFRSIAQHFGLEKLQPNSHLYCAEERKEDFPGRVLRIVEVLDFSKKSLKAVQALGKANLTVRNFPQDVGTLRKRLKLREGGEDYLFATTLHDGAKVLIRCRREA